VHYFRERFTGTKVIVLTQNYRSTQTILDTALSLIVASPDERLSRLPLLQIQTQRIQRRDRLRSRLHQLLKQKPTISPSRSKHFSKARKQRKKTEKQSPRMTSPILVRRNRDIAWLGDALAKRGRSNCGERRRAKCACRPIRNALRRLLHAVNEQRDERLVDVLTLPGFALSAADVWRITQESRKAHGFAIDVLRKSESLQAAGVSDVETARKVFTTLQTLGEKASTERPAVVAELAFEASGLLGAMLQSPNRERSFGAIRPSSRSSKKCRAGNTAHFLPRALQLLTLYEERGIPLRAKKTNHFWLVACDS